MSIEDVVAKYLELIKTECFAKYEKDFVGKVQMGLIKGYRRRFYEPTMVSIVKEIVNNLGEWSATTDKFKISTRSIFIHGKRSLVEFDYYGQRVRRELGDLIFILSVIYEGRKYFEKFTISQFKKDDEKIRWKLSNRGQIYLLSRFPPFRGVKRSIIPIERIQFT